MSHARYAGLFLIALVCGAGQFVFLERDATTNSWHVTHERLTWIS